MLLVDVMELFFLGFMAPVLELAVIIEHLNASSFLWRTDDEIKWAYQIDGVTKLWVVEEDLPEWTETFYLSSLLSVKLFISLFLTVTYVVCVVSKNKAYCFVRLR